jgi:hypothetical protein
MSASPRSSITAWPGPERKARFAALAASRGLSQSRLLGLVIDAVLTRNRVDAAAVDEQRVGAGQRDRVTLRLRPGDGKLLRLRAQSRGMNYTTYAAALIRAHLRASPPLPLAELVQLERSLAEVSAMAADLRLLGRPRQGEENRAGDIELSVIVPAVERLLRQMRELVRANVLSWETGDDEAS